MTDLVRLISFPQTEPTLEMTQVPINKHKCLHVPETNEYRGCVAMLINAPFRKAARLSEAIVVTHFSEEM